MITPGQMAYEAFDATFPADRFARLSWVETSIDYQAAWEAAAQAVAARAITDLLDVQRILTKGQDTPRFQFALGDHVRRTSDPEHRWEIWWRSCREEVDRTFIDYGLRLVDPASDYHPCRMSDGTDLVPLDGASGQALD